MAYFVFCFLSFSVCIFPTKYGGKSNGILQRSTENNDLNKIHYRSIGFDCWLVGWFLVTWLKIPMKFIVGIDLMPMCMCKNTFGNENEIALEVFYP